MNRVQRARERLRALPDWIPDGALALLLASIELLFLWVVTPSAFHVPGYTGPSPTAVAVVCLVTFPLVLRRRYPVAVFVVIAVGASLSVPLSVPSQLYGLIVALYTVATRCDRRWSLTAIGVTVVGTLAAMAAVHELRLLPVNVVIFATAWLLGDRQRTRRAYTAELEARADRLEQEREDRARLAVAEERSRIARELHDVVAHSVSVMVVQAAAARRMLSRSPDLADESIAQVEATGRQSLAEMRRLLGALRMNGEHPDLAPQPGLAQLDDLVDQVRDAGLPVIVTVEGHRRQLASGIDLSAFRIIQEALTNVLKHAGPAPTATVGLEFDQRVLRLEIADDGCGAVPDSLTDARGHGLVGMRERVAVLGGSLHIGPRPGGGFLVRAVLPLDERGVAEPVPPGAA